jgi:hypothetical protein
MCGDLVTLGATGLPRNINLLIPSLNRLSIDLNVPSLVIVNSG